MQVVKDTLVPLGNCGVELEPHSLEVRGLGEGDFQCGGAGSGLAPVVGVASYCAPSLVSREPKTCGHSRAMYGTCVVDILFCHHAAEWAIVNLHYVVSFSFYVMGPAFPA